LLSKAYSTNSSKFFCSISYLCFLVLHRRCHLQPQWLQENINSVYKGREDWLRKSSLELKQTLSQSRRLKRLHFGGQILHQQSLTYEKEDERECSFVVEAEGLKPVFHEATFFARTDVSLVGIADYVSKRDGDKEKVTSLG
jgi:hypothetical protein